MKKPVVIFLALVVSCMIWFGFNRAALPEVPEICGDLSKNVSMEFKINKVSMTEVELQIIDDMDFFVMFQMTGPWKTGQPGLIMKEANKKSKLSKGMSAQAYKNSKGSQGKSNQDFTQFMKDKKGKAVNSYKFDHTIVEGKSGKVFMKMAYQGADIPMIQLLKLEKPITIPTEVRKKFSPEGSITFLPGNYRFDKKINGFYIELDSNSL